VEYDGFAWCKMTLDGSRPLELKPLALEIPLRPQIATLQTVPFLHNGLDLAGNVTSLSAPIEKIPVLWLGDGDGGLQWCAETDRTWEVKNRQEQVQIIPGEREVVVRLNLVDHPATLKGPFVVEFGLQATPARPPLAGWRSFDAWASGYFEQWNYSADEKRRPSYLVAREDIEQYIKNLERQGRRMDFTYWDFGAMWEGIPELAYFLPEWSTQGEWKPAAGGLLPCRGSRSLQDYWLWRLKKTLDEHPYFSEHIAGIYIDGGGPTFCLNRLHGDATLNERGEVVGKYAVLGAREFQKRLYVMFQRHYPSYKIRIHSSGLPFMGQMAFVHALIDGEHVGAAGDEALQRDLNYYHVPWFTFDALRAEFQGWNMGFIPVFLSQTSRRIGGMRAGPEKFLKVMGTPGIPASEHVAGMLLVHDIVPWSAYMNQIPYGRLRGLKENFGWDEDVEFLPYWSNEKYVSLETAADPVVCSLFRRPRKLLVVVMNNSDQDATVAVRLNLETLGISRSPGEALDAYQAAPAKCEVLTDESILAGKPKMELTELPGNDVYVPVKNGVLQVKVKKRNFRALRLSY
jgi:hypothetical protein